MIKQSAIAIGAVFLLLAGASSVGTTSAHGFILGPDAGKQQQQRSSRNQAPAYSGGVLVPNIIENQQRRPHDAQNFGSRRPSQTQQMGMEGPIGFAPEQRPSSRGNSHIYGQGSGAPQGRARSEVEIRDQRVQAFRDRQAQRNAQARQQREERLESRREAEERARGRGGQQNQGSSPVERSFR